MTDDQITQIADQCGMYECHDNGRINGNTVMDFARALLAAAPAPTPQPVAQEPDTVGNLALLVKRMASALQKADPHHFLISQAMAYLQRNDLEGRTLGRAAQSAPVAAPDLLRRLLADHQRTPHHADMCDLCRDAQAAIEGAAVISIP